MSVNKLVDSTQLDADLTSVANAIRAKSGGSGSLAFPAGFVSEIQGIQTQESQNGWSLDGFLNKSEPSGEITINAVATQILNGYNGITKATILSTFTSPGGFLSKCSNLVEVFAPNVTLGGSTYFVENDAKLTTVVVKNANSRYGLGKAAKLAKVDIRTGTLADSLFYNDALLKTIILRSSSIQALYGTSTFNGTPYRSGGGGGKIYIPEILYDCLGDGTSYDYKAASNWSTVDAYGTITWEKIEGSQYEYAYANGSPIPTVTITYDLTNCTSSNNATSGTIFGSYMTTITADNGHSLSSVVVTRAGTDITSSVYDNATGNIVIRATSGDIVITAIAE